MTQAANEFPQDETDDRPDATPSEHPDVESPDVVEIAADDEPTPDATEESLADEYKDKWLRAKAELENVQKRSRRELAQARVRAHVDMASRLLDVIDNLDRALDSVPEEEADQGLAQGVRMVHQQLMERMGTFGIERIDAVGKPLDPHRHEALLEHETADAEPGTVLQVLMPGYVLGDQLVRAAQVQVARAPAASSQTPDAEA